MRHSRSRARRAFTLVEVLIALVVLGIIGAALVRMILQQSRFAETQMAHRNARTVSRNAMNIMLTDLRMVQDRNGLVSAGRAAMGVDGVAHDSVIVRVPVAFGLFCGSASGQTILSLLPVDPAMTSLGYFGGWAIRDSVSQVYSFADANPPIPFTSLTELPSSAVCSNALAGGPGITQVTYNGSTGKIVTFNLGPGGPSNPGWPAFIYHQVTYVFTASTAFQGRVGLFRKVRIGTGNNPEDFKTDEIIAPFDSSAGFRYYVLNEDTAQVAPPADLNTVRGLQLYLAGSSPGTPRNEQAKQAALVTGVFFKNRRDP
jgi:prepilin-type N-terminal cleavage/methylation domain-containing protein